MAGTAVLGRLTWQVAEVVRRRRRDAARQDASCSSVPRWPGHRAGPARRRPPDRRGRLPGAARATRSRRRPRTSARRAHGRAPRRRRGLAVPVDELRPGDQLELRGPIGGYFVWEHAARRPAAARRRRLGRRPADGDDPRIAARPEATFRHAAALSRRARCDDVIYRDELDAARTATGSTCRAHADPVTAARLERLRPPYRRRDAGRRRPGRPSERPLTYVCGPTSFVETVARARSSSSATSRHAIKTERFGPTGG